MNIVENDTFQIAIEKLKLLIVDCIELARDMPISNLPARIKLADAICELEDRTEDSQDEVFMYMNKVTENQKLALFMVKTLLEVCMYFLAIHDFEKLNNAFNEALEIIRRCEVEGCE